MKPIAFDLNAKIEDINLILKHVPLQNEDDKLLFKVYLSLLFLEKIPTVILIIFSKNPHSITIKNSIIAESYSRYFDMLWQQGRISSLL